MLSFGCDDCSRRGSDHCSDCVVNYMCADDGGAVVVSLDEMRLVRRLQDAGLASAGDATPDPDAARLSM